MRWWWMGALLVVGCSGTEGTGDPDAGTDAAGDDDDDGTTSQELVCEDTFTPCGGDPVGDWEVTGFCTVSSDIEGLDCDELTITILEDRSTGSVNIASDGTYTRTYNVDVDAEIAFPNTCISPIPCALVPPASGGVITSCVDDGTTCTCQGTIADEDTAAGNWVAAGTGVDFDGDHWETCITGNQAIAEDPNGARVMWRK